MPPSPHMNEARRLIAGEAWREPALCAELVARLRRHGETALADQLEQAAKQPATFPGGTTFG